MHTMCLNGATWPRYVETLPDFLYRSVCNNDYALFPATHKALDFTSAFSIPCVYDSHAISVLHRIQVFDPSCNFFLLFALNQLFEVSSHDSLWDCATSMVDAFGLVGSVPNNIAVITSQLYDCANWVVVAPFVLGCDDSNFTWVSHCVLL